MSEIGISTSCYYPQITEETFLKLAQSGVGCTEIFFNSISEISDGFIDDLCRVRDEYGIRISAVHPFMSFAEGFYLFSDYERRFLDMLPFYDRFFQITKKLGADYFILHGAKLPCSIDKELYFERFAILTEHGKKQDVRVCQENVVHYCSQSPDFLKELSEYIGEDFGMVLDIKQARRAGFPYSAFLGDLTPAIRHIHISDCDSSRDCITPGDGTFDFASFFREMQQNGYTGNYMIELYRHSYNSADDIIHAYKMLKSILP